MDFIAHFFYFLYFKFFITPYNLGIAFILSENFNFFKNNNKKSRMYLIYVHVYLILILMSCYFFHSVPKMNKKLSCASKSLNRQISIPQWYLCGFSILLKEMTSKGISYPNFSSIFARLKVLLLVEHSLRRGMCVFNPWYLVNEYGHHLLLF